MPHPPIEPHVAVEAARTEVIQAIYEGVLEDPCWSMLLTRARGATGADYASLVFRRSDAAAMDIEVMSSGFGTAPRRNDELAALLRASRLRYEALTPEQPYRLSDLIQKDKVEHLAYRAYLEKRLLKETVVVRVTEPGVADAWLTLGWAEPGLDSEAVPFLANIAPHLRIAARLRATLEREHTRAGIAGEAIRRLHIGWLTFDQQARVVDLSADVARLLHTIPQLETTTRGHPLKIKERRRATLLGIIASFAAKPDLPPRAIHLVDDPWLDMLVMPIQYRPVSSEIAPVAVGYVRGIGEGGDQRCDLLTQLFSLTDNEARLALAITQGRSIAEAAAELNLALETARNYSKRIYAKTGTRGQADLVRVILASVLALS